jgi:hypothetical protein
MLITALLFFALAALLGSYLLSFILQNKNTPKGVAFTHGTVAAIGLLILITYALFNRPSPIVSIIIFVLAVFGGIMLIYKDLTGQPIPKWLALGHGVTALIGFLSLLIFTFAR